MKKSSISTAVLTWLCMGFMFFILCFIGLKFITQNVLVERLHIDNSFTKIILGYDEENASEIKRIDMDWEALYPHCNAAATTAVSASEPLSSILDVYRYKIEAIKTSVSSYATDLLPGYKKITEAAQKYEDIIDWGIVPYSEYNGVHILENGYLAGFTSQKNISDSADATIALSQFCEKQGADFLYVEYPSKISKYEDTDISGISDFSNQNADEFLSCLDAAGVSYLDIREPIHDTGLSHRDLFYNTDHHWKAETGLWASGLILQELHDRFGMDTHSSVLTPENFDYVLYPDWFLGSQGKKITLAQATPDDITLIYPKAKTQFHYEIPNLSIDTTGDFSITYDMSQITECDLYNKNPYGAYNHADQPLIKLENKLIGDNGKLLIIHTSFSNCVIPFLAMDIKNVDALDLRHFTGSVEEYIRQTMPDAVIVASTCGQEDSVDDWTSHTNIWDFS